jgi:hypothetical protein
MSKAVLTPELVTLLTALSKVFAVDDNGNIIIGGKTAAATKPKKGKKDEDAADEGGADEDAGEGDGDGSDDGDGDEGDDDGEDGSDDGDGDGDDGDSEGGDGDEGEGDGGDEGDGDADAQRDAIRPLLKKHIDKKGKDATKALLKKFGATSLTDMKDGKLAGFKEALSKALKAK